LIEIDSDVDDALISTGKSSDDKECSAQQVRVIFSLIIIIFYYSSIFASLFNITESEAG